MISKKKITNMNKLHVLLILTLSLLLGDIQKNQIGFSGSIGLLSPINGETRSQYSTGYITSLMIKFPKKINILNHDFTILSEMNISMLNGNEIENINMVSGSAHLETSFNKSPIGMRIGTGIANHSYSGIVGLANLDFLHQLELKNVDISIELRLQQVINITDNYRFDFNHNLYGININFGRSIH